MLETIAGTRIGDWSQTFTGRAFWPLDPRPEEVCIEDIAHHLALLCRFAGACREPYSVAQHSVLVAREIDRRRRPRDGAGVRGVVLAGLLHDAAEAYAADVPRPLKRYLAGYDDIELGILRVVWQRFGVGLDDAMDSVVGLADDILLATERRDLMGPSDMPWERIRHVEPLPVRIVPWSWRVAEAEFLTAFSILRGAPDA